MSKVYTIRTKRYRNLNIRTWDVNSVPFQNNIYLFQVLIFTEYQILKITGWGLFFYLKGGGLYTVGSPWKPIMETSQPTRKMNMNTYIYANYVDQMYWRKRKLDYKEAHSFQSRIFTSKFNPFSAEVLQN